MKVLLIGFQYKYSQHIKKLPGIAVDLYQVYSFFKNIENKEIKIFTDIDIDSKTDILKRSIIDNVVDSGILSFIEDTKDKKQHQLYKSHTHYNNFEKIISQWCKEAKQLIIYYTGHSKNQNIILPNDSFFSFERFLSCITRNTDTKCQILIIMDSCNCIGLHLPFYLNGDVFRLSFNKKIFVNRDIICISSSNENESSTATKKGSHFTQKLFDVLEKYKNLSLPSVLKKLQKFNESFNIYSSVPTLKYIWGWVYGFSTLTVEIVSDIIYIRY